MLNLLIIADPLDTRFNLLDRAVFMASSSNVELHILNAQYVRGLDGFASVSPKDIEALKKSILVESELKIKNALKAKGINPKKAVIHNVWDKNTAAQAIILSKQCSPDFILKYVHKSNVGLFQISTDSKLIKSCPAPIMFSTGKAYRKKHRVLVALDLMTTVKSKIKLNQKLLIQAQKYSQQTGAEIHILYCLPRSQILHDLDVMDLPAHRNEVRKQIAPMLKEIQAEYGIDKDHCIFKTGQPARIITSVAQKLKIDIIMMGSIGRHGLKGRILGNTAEQSLQMMACDLLLIGPGS